MSIASAAARPFAAFALAGAVGCVALGAYGAGSLRPDSGSGSRASASDASAAQRPAPSPRAARPAFAGPFAAQVVSVVDGDTFRARVAVWFGQEVETSVRLRGVDAPERAGRCAAETEGAARATLALEELLASGRVTLANVSGDKYFGRVVADVVVSSPEAAFPPTDVGEALLAAGLARPYGGKRREGWCELRQAGARTRG